MVLPERVFTNRIGGDMTSEQLGKLEAIYDLASSRLHDETLTSHVRSDLETIARLAKEAIPPDMPSWVCE